MTRAQKTIFVPLLTFFCVAIPCRAGDLDTMGVTLLRQFDSTLLGNGVSAAQVEAPADANIPPRFEINPAKANQPVSLFTWISDLGISSEFPNTNGLESGHADLVGGNFYGVTNGVAPGVSHIDNYEANYFFNNIIGANFPSAIPARVVNQSFIFDDPADEQSANQNYDDFAAQFGTIFVSGIAGIHNVPPLAAPGTSYNGIGVGVFGAFFVPGPTSDGRCKPDIVAPDAAQAPNGAVSYVTPYGAGAAAVLLQAATRGDGGNDFFAATNLLTIKSLLLNGAVKPAGWTNGATTPLDARYGAGVLNIFNSWNQLKGKKNPFIESTSVTTGAAHPPGANSGNESSLVGWDFNSLPASLISDGINHYYFDATNVSALTATLAWNRQKGASGISDLNLFLYDTGSGALVDSSVSAVDNVEHLYVPRLAAGRYDLQVWKKASLSPETYAVAFQFISTKLNIASSNSIALISWPAFPDG
ncbi:MAG TPA: hypothetical protein VFM25_13820, partial [Verrucomicrobiae bacterium]|nr:hypothetical protein [Verrucomicrobiae bacterium]